MTQNEQQLASAHTLLHENAMPQYEQTVADDSKHTGEADDEQFYCVHGEHWFRRKDAQYPKAKTPAMCRVCATKRREQNRTKSELERMEQEKAIDQIPPKGARGGTVRRNLTISQYAATALGVLAVGSSEAATLEMIILDYLRRQDPDVIAFVGRTFEKAQKR